MPTLLRTTFFLTFCSDDLHLTNLIRVSNKFKKIKLQVSNIKSNEYSSLGTITIVKIQYFTE